MEEKERHEFEMGKEAMRQGMKQGLAWYGWGSPVGLGLFLVEIAVFLWVLHLAGILH